MASAVSGLYGRMCGAATELSPRRGPASRCTRVIISARLLCNLMGNKLASVLVEYKDILEVKLDTYHDDRRDPCFRDTAVLCWHFHVCEDLFLNAG